MAKKRIQQMQSSDIKRDSMIGIGIQIGKLKKHLVADEVLNMEFVRPHSAVANPAPENDGVDTAEIGKTFNIGDIWINTAAEATLAIFMCLSNATGRAIWTQITNAVPGGGEPVA